MGASLLDKEWTLRFPHIVLLVAFSLGLLTVVFSLRTATSAWSFPVFVVATVLVVYVPGRVVLGAAGARTKRLDRLSLSLILGIAASSMIYVVCGLMRLQTLFLLWPIAACGWWVYLEGRAWPVWWNREYSVDLSHVMLMAVVVVCLIPLAVLPMYYANLDLLSQGGMTFLRRPNDAIFHLSITNELTHSMPPEAPFLAGRPLGYHFGMDLLPALFAGTAGVSVLDTTVRFVPTLLVVTMVLSVFSFSRLWLGSGAWAVLCALLVTLGEDLSFVPGLIKASEEIWSAQFFGVPTTYSLYFMNPMLPALGMLFAGLFCLVKFCNGSGKSWGVLSAFLFAVVTDYKIFTTLHVLFALWVVGMVCFVRSRQRSLLSVAVLTLVIAAPLVLYSWVGAEGGSRVWVRLDPWPYVAEMLEQFGVLGTTLGGAVDALFRGDAYSLAGLAGLALLGLPIYLIGSLGARLVAIPPVLQELSIGGRGPGMGLFLALFCILGPLATLLLTVTPWGYPPTSEYNNSVWFFVQSKYVLWILAVQWLSRLLRNRRGRWQLMVAAAVVLVSVPSSLQFFHLQASHPASVLSNSELELAEAMRGKCASGEVAMARQEVGELVAALTPCRLPVLNLGIYPHSFISMSELEERRSDRDSFWRGWNQGSVREDILDRYGVQYVLVDQRSGDEALGGPGDSVSEGTKPPGTVTLVLLFENDDFLLYQVNSRGLSDA